MRPTGDPAAIHDAANAFAAASTDIVELRTRLGTHLDSKLSDWRGQSADAFHQSWRQRDQRLAAFEDSLSETAEVLKGLGYELEDAHSIWSTALAMADRVGLWLHDTGVLAGPVATLATGVEHAIHQRVQAAQDTERRAGMSATQRLHSVATAIPKPDHVAGSAPVALSEYLGFLMADVGHGISNLFSATATKPSKSKTDGQVRSRPSAPPSAPVVPPSPAPATTANPPIRTPNMVGGVDSICAIYAQARRSDLRPTSTYGPPGADKGLGAYRYQFGSGAWVSHGTSDIRPGDALVWNPKQDGADPDYGHVAIVERVMPGQWVIVSESGMDTVDKASAQVNDTDVSALASELPWARGHLRKIPVSQLTGLHVLPW
jgi:WXG100 family type VII secretion target